MGGSLGIGASASSDTTSGSGQTGGNTQATFGNIDMGGSSSWLPWAIAGAAALVGMIFLARK